MPDIPNRDELERKIARLLGRFNKTQLGDLLEMMGNSPKMNKIPPSFWTESEQALAAELVPFSEMVYLEAAERVVDSVPLPIGFDWTLVNQDAADWAVREVGKLVTKITDTTRKRIGSAVSSYFTETETIGDLEKQLARMVDRFGNILGPKRAEMISVTEITRAASQGELGVARQLKNEGIEMRKVWQTNKDDLVCETICEPLQGVEESTWRSVAPDGPPAHVRCRCFLSLLLPGAEKPAAISTGGIQPSIERYSDEEYKKINDWYTRGEDVSARHYQEDAKHKLVKSISDRSGLDYEQTNQMIKQWSHTSNDANPNSLQLQKRASELFDIPMSDWQKSKYAKFVKPIDITDPYWSNADVDRFLKAMYANTQDELASAGLKTVKLQRGIALEAGDIKAMKEAGMRNGKTMVMEQNVMESWTYHGSIADDFGNVILEVDVPADRIIGTARTGFGCLDEFEFIVLGSDAEELATIIKLGMFGG